MLEDVVIIAAVMAIAELIKSGLKRVCTEDTVKQVTPLIVIGLAAGLNAANAVVFSPETPWVQALGQGVVMGVLASGAYSQAKALLGKS